MTSTSCEIALLGVVPMSTKLTAVDRRPCPAKPRDYIEFFAEIDVLMALSTCPGGDLSAWSFGGGADDMLATCRPLRVEVWEITDQALLKDWEPSEPPAYKGLHGIDLP